MKRKTKPILLSMRRPRKRRRMRRCNNMKKNYNEIGDEC